jgi:hypothetical protein
MYALALFGRRPAQSAERLVVAGVQKPAQLATSPGWLNEYSVLRRETTAAHPSISSLASRLNLVDPEGYEGTDEAHHENAGSRYGDEVN